MTKLISVTPVTPTTNGGVTMQIKEKKFKNNNLHWLLHLLHLLHRKINNNVKHIINLELEVQLWTMKNQ